MQNWRFVVAHDFIVSALVIVVVNCQPMEVQIKNELPVPPADAPPDDSVLRIYCRLSYITDPGVPMKILLHKEKIYRYLRHRPVKCRYLWKGLHQDFIVSGDDRTSGPCPTEADVEQCKWEARGDGFYFYTADFAWKKIRSWGTKDDLIL